MNDEFETTRFATAAELLRALQERSDDFERVTIAVPNELLLTGPQGQRQVAANVCGSVALCDGRTLLIHREDLELLLNDGILSRLKIPVSLAPP